MVSETNELLEAGILRMKLEAGIPPAKTNLSHQWKRKIIVHFLPFFKGDMLVKVDGISRQKG